MGTNREKNYWIKNNVEIFTGKDSATKSQDRVSILKGYGNDKVAFVRRNSQADGSYKITYSVAKWFELECENAGIKI